MIGQADIEAAVGSLLSTDGGQLVDEHGDNLTQARRAYAAQDWCTAAAHFDAVATERLTADDLAAYADAAWWLGRIEDNLRLSAAACDAFLTDSRPVEAAWAAMVLGIFHLSRGDEPQGMGWIGRAGRLLEGIPECRCTVAELAGADLAVVVGEFGPRMGTWYAALGRGHGSAVVDDTPWVARGHGRERTFQRGPHRTGAGRRGDPSARRRGAGGCRAGGPPRRPAHPQGPVHAVFHQDVQPHPAGADHRRRGHPRGDLGPGRQTPGRATDPAAGAARRDDDARAGPGRAHTLTSHSGTTAARRRAGFYEYTAIIGIRPTSAPYATRPTATTGRRCSRWRSPTRAW
jgi:hypothetical protein